MSSKLTRPALEEKPRFCHNFYMSRSAGYTIIELIIVMTIIGVIAVLSLYGLRSQNNTQIVSNTQLEFVTNLRSVINGVNQGSNGQNFYYLTINNTVQSYSVYKSDNTLLTTYSLPSNIHVCFPDGSAQIAFCAANRYFTTYSALLNQTCACGDGVYFACKDSTKVTTGSVIVRFSQATNCVDAANAYHKDVVIEGNSMQITRVNAL